MADSNVPQARRVKFKKVVKDTQGPRVGGHEIIDENEEYSAWLAACSGDTDRFPRPPDWKTTMFIGIALGERRTGGYDIEIVAINEIVGGFVGVQWEVLYRITEPRGPVTDVITAPQHMVSTRHFNGVITFKRFEDPVYTTLALGEEDPRPTTLAVGEEDPRPTTLAVGEEDPPATTLAVGEEDPTTLAVGEEGPHPTTLAVGEEGPQPTTFALGEEGPQPTTFRIGEEGGSTFAWGEEGPTTMRWGEEGPTTFRWGEEGPTTRMWGEEDPWGQGGGGDPFGGF